MKTDNMKQMMVYLAEVESNGSPVLSCLVNLKQTNLDAVEDIYRHAVVLRRGLGVAQAASFDQALKNITGYLLETPMAEASGAILYARGGSDPFLKKFSTGASFQTALIVDDLPHLYPLVETHDIYHRFVVVSLSESEARIFETMVGSVTNEVMMERPDLRKKIGREWTRERYQNHKSDREDRFTQSKIEVLEKLMTKHGHNHLIVAGNPKIVSRFTKALPTRLAETLVDTLNVNPNTGASPIILEALDAFVASENQESHDHVEMLESAIMRRGLGISGEEEVRKALESGCADVLIIDQDYADTFAKEQLVKLALSSGAEIETVSGSEKLARFSGVGCLLRYRPTYPLVQEIVPLG